MNATITMLDTIRAGAARQKPQGGNVTHGHTLGGDSPTYISWSCMLVRVRHPERDRNGAWAKAGVTVCDRWLKFESFLEDMGERPRGKTLDRYPNQEGNYEPGNCRWATPSEQARNTRNSILTFNEALEIAVAMLQGAQAKGISEQYGICVSLPREIAKRRKWKDAHDAARLQLGLNLCCPFCGCDDLPLAAKVCGRFVVACENEDCKIDVQAAGATPEEAWKIWNARI